MLKKRVLCAVLFAQLFTSVSPTCASGPGEDDLPDFGGSSVPAPVPSDDLRRLLQEAGRIIASMSSVSGSGSGLPSDWAADGAASSSAAPQTVVPVAPLDDAGQPVAWETFLRDFHIGKLRTDHNLALLRSVARDESDPRQWQAIARLWDSKLENNSIDQQKQDRRTLYPLLLQAAQDPEHPKHYEAIKIFWWGDTSHENRSRLRDAYLKIACNFNHPHQYKAISDLWDVGRTFPENQTSLYPLLLKMLQNPESPYQLDAVHLLWSTRYAQQEEGRSAARPLMLQIAHNSEHPRHFDMMYSLWDSYGEDRDQNREDFLPVLIAIAQNFEHRRQWDAIEMLWDSPGEGREAVRPALIEIAHNPEHSQQWSAIQKLWNSSGEDEAQNQAAVLPAFAEFVLNARSDHQRQVLNAMKASQDIRLRSLGRFLQIGCFPTPENLPPARP